MTNKINIRLFIAIIAISFSGFLMVSCEKETDDLLIKESNNVDIPNYVNYSWYNNNRSTGGEKLPFRWVSGGLGSTTIDLDNEGGDCLPTTDGDCFPDVVVRSNLRSVNLSDFTIYDIYKSYNGNVISFFINEEWELLFPMLKQQTVDLLINGNMELSHYYNESKGIAYFCFANSTDIDDNIFTIQLRIE